MSADTDRPSTLVVGVGYTGRRVLGRLPATTSIGLSRSADDRLPVAILNLDDDLAAALTPVPGHGYSVLYTVPPARGNAEDPRLQRFLDVLPHPPARFVYLSTTGVYGDRGGACVDEIASVAPASDRALRRVAAEERLAAWSAQNGSELLVLRVPGIYGPGRLGTGNIREQQPVIAESDANPGNRIHVDDLATCCIAALSADRPAGTYNVGDGDTRSSTWFAMEVARQLGIEAPPTVSRKEAMRMFSPLRLSFLRESRTLDLTKMRMTLKPDIRYNDAADGIAASLQEELNSAD